MLEAPAERRTLLPLMESSAVPPGVNAEVVPIPTFPPVMFKVSWPILTSSLVLFPTVIFVELIFVFVELNVEFVVLKICAEVIKLGAVISWEKSNWLQGDQLT